MIAVFSDKLCVVCVSQNVLCARIWTTSNFFHISRSTFSTSLCRIDQDMPETFPFTAAFQASSPPRKTDTLVKDDINPIKYSTCCQTRVKKVCLCPIFWTAVSSSLRTELLPLTIDTINRHSTTGTACSSTFLDLFHVT